MSKHAVVIAGGGPTGMMLAGELALTGNDVFGDPHEMAAFAASLAWSER